MIVSGGNGPTICVSIPIPLGSGTYSPDAQKVHDVLTEFFPRNHIVVAARKGQINAAIGEVSSASRADVAMVLEALGFARVDGQSIATLVPPQDAPLRVDDRCAPEVAHAFRRLIGRELVAGESEPVDALSAADCVQLLDEMAPTALLKVALAVALIWGRADV